MDSISASLSFFWGETAPSWNKKYVCYCVSSIIPTHRDSCYFTWSGFHCLFLCKCIVKSHFPRSSFYSLDSSVCNILWRVLISSMCVSFSLCIISFLVTMKKLSEKKKGQWSPLVILQISAFSFKSCYLLLTKV